MAAGRGDSDSGVGTMTTSGDADVTVDDVYLRISVPDAHTEKSMQFKSDDLVWTVKQRVLATCGHELKDSLNYGLYVPSSKVKAGKFLDEERPLLDYPFASPVGQLELRYKKRQYKDAQFDQKKLRQLHTKSNFKLFMSAVKNNDVEKVESWTSKGLDPNFQDADTGETPMTLCCGVVVKCRNMLLALYAGGAFVDYRNREGLTPMHRAAEKGNSVAIKTLLDLGASTNYKDARNLTPLYLCVMNTMDTNCAQMLLHDHSVVDTVDAAGFTETHQACKDGRSSHVDQLLFYGADIDAQNSSGNTPLHICSLNNQLSCARILLFRGADRTIQNRDGQDAFHAAILAGNKELADLIKNYSPNDIVLHQEEPKLNEKRRGTLTTVRRRVRQIPSVYNVFGTLSESATDPNLSSRASDTESNVPRTVVLQRGAAGFGFVLSGIKSGVSEGRTVLSSFKPTPQTPAAQFFENVDPGSAAEKAGIKKGDFVLEINGEDVRSMSHEYTVRLIKETRETLIVKVIAPKVVHPKVTPYTDGTQTLPLKRGAPYAPVRGTNTTLSPSSGASMQASMTAELDKLDKLLATHDTEEPVYAPIIKVPPPPTVSAATTDINGNNVKTASIGHRHGKTLTASLSTENFQTFGKAVPEVITTSATYATYSSATAYSLPASKRSDSVPNLALAASRQRIVAINVDDDDKAATTSWSNNTSAPPSHAYSSITINSNVPYYVEEAINRTREAEEMAARLDPPAGYANSPVRYSERSAYASSEVGGTGYRNDSGNIDDNRSSRLYKTQSSRDRDAFHYSTVRQSAPVSLTDEFSQPTSSYLPPSVNGQARGRDKSDAYSTNYSTISYVGPSSKDGNYSGMSQYYTPPPPPPANNSYSKPSASIAGYPFIPPPPPLPPVTMESKPQATARVNGHGTVSGIPAELQASSRKQDTAHAALMAEVIQRRKRIASEDGDSGESQFADKKNYSTGKLNDSSALSSVRSNKSKSVVELSTGGGNYLSTAEPSHRDLVPLKNGNRQTTDNRPTSAIITSLKLPAPVKSVLPPTQSVTNPTATAREQTTAYSDRQQVLPLPTSVSLSTSAGALTESSNNKVSPAVGNFAASVAKRAEERRENFESIIDEAGNAKGQPTGTKIIYSAIPSRNSGGVTATSSSNNNSRSAVSASMPVSAASPLTDLHRASPAKSTAAAATVKSQQFSASADKSSLASRSSTSIVYKATAASDGIPPPPGFDDDSRTRNGASRNDSGSTTSKLPSDNRYSAANNKSNSSVNGGVLKSSVEKKSVAGWTVNDVCAWLDGQHLFELTEMFVNHGVNGQKLLTLGRDDLVRMGVKQAGQRMTLECAIKRLAT